MKFIKENPTVTIAVCILVVLLSLFSLFRKDKAPQGIQEQFSALYKAWAAQADQLGNALEDGSSVILMDFDRERLGFKQSEFKKALDSLSNTGVVIQDVVKVYPKDSGEWDFDKSGFPYSEFVRVAERYPDADAVIAFCGVPYFSQGSERSDPSRFPKLLVAASQFETLDAETLYEQGWLYAASVPRGGVGQPTSYELLHEE